MIVRIPEKCSHTFTSFSYRNPGSFRIKNPEKVPTPPMASAGGGKSSHCSLVEFRA
jgi:hypothetical protein